MRNGKAEETDKYCLGKGCAALDGSPTFYRYEDDDNAEEDEEQDGRLDDLCGEGVR